VKKCAVPDCARLSAVRGWCRKHYVHWYIYGDPVLKLREKSHVNHQVRFTPELWHRWQRARDPEHPHCLHLKEGIRIFRAKLESRT
jgi:hypothetical protein